MKGQKTTTVIVRHANGKYLGVSRKYDHNSFGFAGGKCDDGEESARCAVRELEEETGLHATSMNLLDIREYVNKTVDPPTLDTVYCYRINTYKGELLSNEELIARGEGILKWVDKEELLKGAFGDYNEAIFTDLNGKI